MRAGAQLAVEVVKPARDGGDPHLRCHGEHRSDVLGRPVELALLQVRDSCPDPYLGPGSRRSAVHPPPSSDRIRGCRHVGGTLAAATGASLKELMARLGHSSGRAALIYPARDQGQGSGHRQGPWRPGATGPADWPGSGYRRCITPLTGARLWPEAGGNEVQ